MTRDANIPIMLMATITVTSYSVIWNSKIPKYDSMNPKRKLLVMDARYSMGSFNIFVFNLNPSRLNIHDL